MAQPIFNERASASTSSTRSRRSTINTHHYVGEREAEVIQEWSSRVPDKLPKEHSSAAILDPSVQAYIAAKLALLRSSTPAR